MALRVTLKAINLAYKGYKTKFYRVAETKPELLIKNLRDRINNSYEMDGSLRRLKGISPYENPKVLGLYKFLRENITFTTELLTGIELFPFQHMAVKAMMQNDYFLGIWSRGMSKSFSTGIFALLDAMLNQGVHIGIISKSFRQSSLNHHLIIIKS